MAIWILSRVAGSGRMRSGPVSLSFDQILLEFGEIFWKVEAGHEKPPSRLRRRQDLDRIMGLSYAPRPHAVIAILRAQVKGLTAGALPTILSPIGIEDFSIFQIFEYAIHNQRDRRNITDAEYLKCVEVIDSVKSKGRPKLTNADESITKMASREAISFGKSATNTSHDAYRRLAPFRRFVLRDTTRRFRRLFDPPFERGTL